MRRLSPPEDIAGVAVTVCPDIWSVTQLSQQVVQRLQQVFGQSVIVRFVLRKDKLLTDQLNGCMAEGLTIQAGTMFKASGCRDGMHASQCSPHDQQVVQVVKLGGVTSLAGVEGITEAVKVEEAVAGFVNDRCNDRQFVLDQFKTESMLFNNLFVTPASGAVKLGDQRLTVFNAHLVNTIFITV